VTSDETDKLVNRVTAEPATTTATVGVDELVATAATIVAELDVRVTATETPSTTQTIQTIDDVARTKVEEVDVRSGTTADIDASLVAFTAVDDPLRTTVEENDVRNGATRPMSVSLVAVTATDDQAIVTV
jgi:hypothetical protein